MFHLLYCTSNQDKCKGELRSFRSVLAVDSFFRQSHTPRQRATPQMDRTVSYVRVIVMWSEILEQNLDLFQIPSWRRRALRAILELRLRSLSRLWGVTPVLKAIMPIVGSRPSDLLSNLSRFITHYTTLDHGCPSKKRLVGVVGSLATWTTSSPGAPLTCKRFMSSQPSLHRRVPCLSHSRKHASRPVQC